MSDALGVLCRKGPDSNGTKRPRPPQQGVDKQHLSWDRVSVLGTLAGDWRPVGGDVPARLETVVGGNHKTGVDRRVSPVHTIGYVPALDGVRAVAIIAVLLLHGGVSWAQGGYLGV